MSTIKNEPVVAAAVATVGSLIGLLAAFGVDVSAAEKEAILAFVGTVSILAVLVRQAVTPNHKVGA